VIGFSKIRVWADRLYARSNLFNEKWPNGITQRFKLVTVAGCHVFEAKIKPFVIVHNWKNYEKLLC